MWESVGARLRCWGEAEARRVEHRNKSKIERIQINSFLVKGGAVIADEARHDRREIGTYIG